MPARKSHQIASLRAERELIGQEMENLRERLAVLERRGNDVSAKLAHIEVAGRTRMGKPTLSRAIVRVAWEDFQRMTWQRHGVTTDDLFESMRAKVPDLRKATLRVYLHRFWKRTGKSTSGAVSGTG